MKIERIQSQANQANEDKAASDDGEMDLGEEEYAAQYEVEDLLKMVGENALKQKWSNLDDSSPSQADHGIERNGRETDDQEDRRHQLQVLLRQTGNRSFPSGMKRIFVAPAD